MYNTLIGVDTGITVKLRSVAMIDENGIIEKVFSSPTVAARAFGYDKSSITAMCNNSRRLKSYKGKNWKYIRDIFNITPDSIGVKLLPKKYNTSIDRSVSYIPFNKIQPNNERIKRILFGFQKDNCNDVNKRTVSEVIPNN